MMENEKLERVQSIDALRGLSVILMVAHHFLYDLTVFLEAPEWLFSNPVFDVLHYVFAGIFIMLSGVSSRFSRSNVKRGIRVIILALLITLVTRLMDMTVLFGVLHFLGFSMVFYGLTGRLWNKILEKAAPFIYIVGLILSAVLVSRIGAIESRWLWPLGFTYEGFRSTDYFPVLPWIFVFLFGTWLGKLVKERRLPERVYTINPPFLPKVGRRALLIYVLHQPVLYAITMGIRVIIR